MELRWAFPCLLVRVSLNCLIQRAVIASSDDLGPIPGSAYLGARQGLVQTDFRIFEVTYVRSFR